MSDAKCFPGPWKVSAELDQHGWLVFRIQGVEKIDPKSEKAQSCRRLIQESPGLIVVLEKATRELNAILARDGAPQHIEWDRGRPLQLNGCDPTYFRELVGECHAAIAKAKG